MILANHSIRDTLLEVLEKQKPRPGSNGNLQSASVLRETAEVLGMRRDEMAEQQLLTEWHELFRTGFLAWGHNLDNPNPPFCHFTEHGKKALEIGRRDPSNPGGYLAHLRGMASLSPIAESYLSEGLACYVGGLHKAAAVMVGGASERLVLDVRDRVVELMDKSTTNVPEALKDWRIKKVLDALRSYFDQRKKVFPRELKDAYEAYWPAFTQQIRAVRNDAGHPSSIDPITADTVHAALLVFPEIAKVACGLIEWLGEAKEA
jgi:hypothetical protein